MGAMTKLDAVNQILLAAGENIVSDLENNSGVDTTTAEYLLNQYADDGRPNARPTVLNQALHVGKRSGASAGYDGNVLGQRRQRA